MLGSVGATTAAAATADMKWERTWADEVTLRWQPPVEDGRMQIFSTDKWKPEFGYRLNHSCTFTDGNYIYSGYSPFCKYTMEGQYVETMETDELADVWKVAYDGQNFYMMMWDKLGLFIVDPVTFHIKGVVPTPGTFSHFTYIPTLDDGKGGFLLGTINKLYFINRYGDLLDGMIDMTPQISDKYHCASTAYLDGKIYTYNDDNKGGRLVLTYDAKTLQYTGEKFDLNDFAGQGIAPAEYVGRQIFPYTRPDSKQYLLCVDYNYVGFYATSVLIGEKPAAQGMDSFNLYRNGEKLTQSPLGKDDYMFVDKGLAEQTDYLYELKAVKAGGEETVCSQTVNLADTRTLPMIEEFDTYVHPSENWLRFNTWPTNYLYIDNPGDEDSWSVVSYRKNTGNSYMKYYHGTDLKYEKSLVIKPLVPRKGGDVIVEIEYSGLTFTGTILNNEQMHLEVSTDGGKTWQLATTIPYSQVRDQNSYATAIITDLVGDKEFILRLRPDGMNLPQESAKYNWAFYAIKVWDEQPVEISGTVTYNGQTPDSELDLTFTRKDLGDRFEAATDRSGKYSLGDIYAGNYDLTVSNGKYNYTINDISIEEGKTNQSFDIAGGKFASDTQTLTATLAPGTKKTIEVDLSNTGASSAPYAYVEFEGEGKEVYGDNSLEVNPEWKLMNTFNAREAYLNGLPVYFEGNIYTGVANDKYAYITKYNAAGKYIDQIYLTDDSGAGLVPANYFVYNGKLYCYTVPTMTAPIRPGYIAEVDLQNEKILFSQKISLNRDINYIQGMCGAEDGKGFYVMASNSVWQVDEQGRIMQQWELGSGTFTGIALDTFTKGGPYIWTARRDNNGRGIYLEQFDLANRQFTTMSRNVNNDPVSAGNLPEVSSVNVEGQVVMPVSGVTSSTEINPGYYSLIAYQEFLKTSTGPLACQALVYRLFPLYDWVKPLNTAEALDGEGTLTLNLDASKFEDKETRQAKIVITAANVCDDVEIPLSMTVDSSVAAQYPAASDVQATVGADYTVSLSWKAPVSDNAVKGYRLYKDGLELGNVKECSFTDQMPYYGKQAYVVSAEYADGTVVDAAPVEAEVLNAELAKPMGNFTADIKVRKNVELNWDRTPQFSNAFFDDFESYEPFITENIGGWTLYDDDRAYTYSYGEYDYPNEGAKMAAMVFNPSQTQPANVNFVGNGGSQYLAFTCSNLTLIKNDDWAITPELNLAGQSVVRFEGRANTIYRNKEKLLVGYSTTGVNREDFKWIGDTIEFNASWSEIELSIPAETKHVAFRYQSQNVYQFYLDNIYIGSRGAYSAIKGWNIYRDGEKLNKSLLRTNTYTDLQLADGKYKYELETVYENGATARNELDVEVDATIQTNPPRDLRAEKTSDNTADLSWRAPLLADSERIRYDDGEPMWCMSGGEDNRLWVAIQLNAADLEMYEGYSISNIHFHITDACPRVRPFVIEGNNAYIYAAKEFKPKANSWNDYVLTAPVKIEKGKTYRVGYMFEAAKDDDCPASQDKGPGIPGISDLFSADGSTFFSLYNFMQDEEFNLNWNIAVDLEFLPEGEEAQPSKIRLHNEAAGIVADAELTAAETQAIAKQFKRKQMSPKARAEAAEADAERFLGYKVYRNGKCLTAEPIKSLAFTDNGVEKVSEYYVAAVYQKAGEVKSETVKLGETSVDAFEMPDGPFDVYSIDGMLLYRGVESVKELSSGLYIINGVKVLVR